MNIASKITVPTSSGDERGLLGLTFHPNFASNGKFYVDYTRSGDGATTIAEYTTTTGNGSSNTGDVNSERIMLTIPQPFTNHNGGMVEFGPDGYLYIGMGDGGSGNDPGNRAQNRSILLGKLLRIDPNIAQGSNVPYNIPPTNPFTGSGTARCDGGSTTSGTNCQEIFAYGLRNPWRYSFDRGTGQIWAADVGQNSFEEINTIEKGGNYGWRIQEGTECFNPQSGCETSGLEQPVFTYGREQGVSVTGGYVYRGEKLPDLQGWYVYADYGSGTVWALRQGSDGQVENRTLLESGENITSFGVDQ